MGLCDTFDPEEWGKEFVHFMFKELPISVEQKGSRITANQTQDVLIKLNQEEIKILQQEDPQCSKVIQK